MTHRNMNPQEQIKMLTQRLDSLESEYHRNNFEGSQDFNKYVRFNTRLQFPVKATAPSVCEQGEVYVNSGDGKLYVCSAANTWTPQT